MARPIKIDLVADVADVIKGTNSVSERLEELSDDLREVGQAEGLDKLGAELDATARTAGTAGEKITDALDQIGDTAADAFGRVRSEAGDALDPFTATARDAQDRAEAVADSMGQIGDAAGDAFTEVRAEAKGALDPFEKEVKAAGDSADAFRKDAAGAFDKVAAEARASGKTVGKSMGDGLDKAGEGLDEFKDEANGTAREAAASFDGSAESIAEVFQEVAANAFAGFGPAGAAAGLAVAAGLGIALAKAQELAEANTEAAESTADLAGEYIDLRGKLEELDIGGRIREWGLEVQEDNWLTPWANEAESNFEKYADAAEAAGVSTGDAMRGIKGSLEDAQTFLSGTSEEYDRLTEVIRANTEVTIDGVEYTNAAGRAAQDQRDALGELRGEAEKNVTAHESAARQTEIFTEATGEATEASEAAAEAIQGHVDALDDLHGSLVDSVTADLGWRETVAATTATLKENGRNVDLNTAKGRENTKALVAMRDAAVRKRDADIDAGASTAEVTRTVEKQREAFIRAARQAGHTGDAAERLADQWGLVPHQVDTRVEAHTREAKADINAIDRMNPQVDVDVGIRNNAVAAQLRAMQGYRVAVNLVSSFGRSISP